MVVGYGVGLPTSYIPQFEKLMGAENVMIAGEGARYPWSDFEEEQRRNFPTGAPDPLYDKTGQLFGGVINHDPQATGIYVADPRYYPESPCMTLFLPQRYTWCIVNLPSQTLLYKHYEV